MRVPAGRFRTQNPEPRTKNPEGSPPWHLNAIPAHRKTRPRASAARAPAARCRAESLSRGRESTALRADRRHARREYIRRRPMRCPGAERREGRACFRSECAADRDRAASRLLVADRHLGLDAAAHRKIADHDHAARAAYPDEIVENLVCDIFVENAFVAEFDQV